MRRRKRSLAAILTALYAAALTLFSAYVLLETFVIQERYAVVAAQTPEDTQEAAAKEYGSAEETTESISSLTAAPDAQQTSEQAVWTDTSYQGDGLSVTLTTYRAYDSTIYVADIVMADVSHLKTALAEDTYGRNVTELTSAMADRQNAVLAINGDFYGAQRRGYVVRNGMLYRESVSDEAQQDLCIWPDGSISIIEEGDTSAQALKEDSVWQLLSFGPALVIDGEVAVSTGQEVGKAASSNPRTALAMIEPLHYLFAVSDGRTADSAGISLYELADFLQGLGANVAYNLDGGGSSTMVFGGEVVNFPTSWGGKYSERAVSDIVYVQ